MKQRSEFGVRSDGRFSRAACRQCDAEGMRNWHAENRERAREKNRATALRRYHGITVAQYDALALAQNGLCAICGEAPGHGTRKYLDVDHDHVTGRIRGLLCGRCNSALGFMRDHPGWIMNAAEYLRDPFVKEIIYAIPGLPSGIPKAER